MGSVVDLQVGARREGYRGRYAAGGGNGTPAARLAESACGGERQRSLRDVDSHDLAVPGAITKPSGTPAAPASQGGKERGEKEPTDVLVHASEPNGADLML